MAELMTVVVSRCSSGHRPSVYAMYSPRAARDVYTVQCPRCGDWCGKNYDSVDAAVSFWNLRRGGQMYMLDLAVR